MTGGLSLWRVDPAVVARAAAGALLLWTLLALGLEVRRAAMRPERHPGLPPSGWRLGSPQTASLRGFLAQIRESIPDDALIAVDSGVWRDGELFFLMAWCAYDLPRHRVLRLQQLARVHERVHAERDTRPPTYLLVVPSGVPTLPEQWQGRRFEWRQIMSQPGAALYRLRGGGGARGGRGS